MARKEEHESASRLRVDLLSAKALVWLVSAGRHEKLTPEANSYFFDRYRRLADHHRRLGHGTRAMHLHAKAEEYARSGWTPEPPYAAAMSMPRPRAWVITEAVSSRRLNCPHDDAA